MTKQEIRERAEGIVKAACNLQRNYGLLEANGAVEERVISLIRAMLEEAARAQCYWCSRYGAPDLGDKWHRVTYASGGTVNSECLSPTIHDLIAALDKEGDRE